MELRVSVELRFRVSSLGFIGFRLNGCSHSMSADSAPCESRSPVSPEARSPKAVPKPVSLRPRP